MKRPEVRSTYGTVLIVGAVLVVGTALVAGGCVDLTEGTVIGSSEVTTTSELPTTSIASSMIATTTTSASTPDTQPQNPSTVATRPPIKTETDPNLGITPDRLEDTAPHLEKKGTWYTSNSPESSGGTVKMSDDLQCSLGVTFHGTGVRLVTIKGWNGGKIVVHLTGDDLDVLETVSLYSDLMEFQQIVWYSGYLPEGQYHVSFERYVDPNYGSGTIWIDAIDVWGQAFL